MKKFYDLPNKLKKLLFAFFTNSEVYYIGGAQSLPLVLSHSGLSG